VLAVLVLALYRIRALLPVETIKLGVSMAQVLASASSAYRCVRVFVFGFGFVSVFVCLEL
jgi:hypothetical protein